MEQSDDNSVSFIKGKLSIFSLGLSPIINIQTQSG